MHQVLLILLAINMDGQITVAHSQHFETMPQCETAKEAFRLAEIQALKNYQQYENRLKSPFSYVARCVGL
jgi:hypothetical protein